MAKKEVKCPSCGKPVPFGDIACKYCGVNLKSGESYESQVKRARGKARHAEHFADTVLVGTVMAFALIVFAGFMHQRRIEKKLMLAEEPPAALSKFVARLSMIDDLASASDKDAAAQILQYNKDVFLFKTTMNRIVDDLPLVLDSLRAADSVGAYTIAFAQSLVADIEKADADLREPEPFEDKPASSPFESYGGPRFNRKYGYDVKVYKRFLRNLKAKAQAKLEALAAS